MTDVFHAGERAVQQRAGVAERMAEVGPRVIRQALPEQHRMFFAQLPFLVVGSVDAEGQPWASVLAQPPGFVSTPDASQLQVQALPGASDPLARTLALGAALGVLGIEPHTRRRNRVNGTVSAVQRTGFTLQVTQSFGNCPKYIQAREPRYVAPPDAPDQASVTTQLDLLGQQWVQSADTFFIATAHPQPLQDAGCGSRHGVDVSHRGGKPGFVRLEVDAAGQQWLTVPDFMGNFFFNTLGNLLLQPLAGLLFMNYDNGDLLHVAVQAEVVWDGPELARFVGAQRLLRMRVHQATYRPAALPLRWGEAQLSPVLNATGSWT